MISRLPIRYSMPLVLAALALALTAIAGLHDVVVSLRGWEDLMRRRAAGLGNVIVPRLERSLAQNSVADATEEIVGVGVVPDLLLALLVGPDDQIMAASKFEFRSRSLHATRSAGALPLLAGARATMSTQMEISPDSNVLRAAFPVRLTPFPGELRDSRIALLYTESDLATQRRLDLAKILRRSLFMGLMACLACAGVWVYFHFRFAKRVARLVERADALAQGKSTSLSPFEGVDELAQISTAINRMTVGLQEHESHTSTIFAHAMDCIIMIDHEGRILDFNPAAERTFGHTRERVLGCKLAELIIPPALRAAHVHGLAHHLATGESRVLGRRIEVSALRADGTEFPVELAITRLPGESARFVGFLRDITERKHADLRLAAHRDLLAGVATGQSLAVSLDAICRFVESQAQGMLCSVLVLDADGAHLRQGAAPSLPAAYCAAIDGLAIGPAAGSCGTAVFRREAVTVSDIATDPLWENYKALALAHGLRACWSTPILGSDGAVLGTFAMYYPTVREPEPEHRQLIAIATQTAVLALQREHAGATLRASEARFRAIFTTGPECVKVVSPAGQLLEMNAAGFEMFEVASLAEVQARPLLEWIAAAHRVAFSQLHAQVMRGESGSLEFEIIGASGTRRWVHTHAAPLRDEQGNIRALLGITGDITERKSAEAALRQSEERFAKAYRSSPVAMLISAMADGRLIDVNESFVRLFGHERREDLLGRTAFELGLWRDPAERERLRVDLAQSGSLKQFETVFHKQSGELGHALASVERIELQGEPCSLSIIYDITARKHAEALLEASLDGLNEGVMVSELDGHLVRWNRAALRMHDYATLDECRRRMPEFTDTFELLASDGGEVPFAQWPIERILRGETVHEWEVRLRHKRAGWVKLIVYSGTLVRDAAGSPLLALLTMTNITERRQLEEQLRQSQKMDAIGQLAGGVAHDFNNILTAITLHAELASAHPGLPAEVAETLREISSASDRAASLTNQLLLFSRQQVMQVRHFNFSDAVTTSAKLLKRLLGEDVRLDLILHPRPLPICADEGMLGQVLLNLGINARDAMPHGGRLLIETTERVVGAEEAQLHPGTAPGRYACLRVQDTGQGIAPVVLPRIFEPFFSTKAVGKGTGLGLATVFGVVQQHRGWIAVESKLDKGTTFLVFLPLVEPPVEVEKTKSAVAMPRGSETILLVEDENAVRYTVRALLERHGYRLLVAEHGPAALALWQLEHGKIDLLLTDLVMPGGLGGRELAAQLQAESPALKVIVMSGYSADFAGRDIELPARQRFLQKPFTLDALLTTVRSALDAH